MNKKFQMTIFSHAFQSPTEPIIFIDTERLKNNFSEFISMKSENVKLIFPVKSFPHEEALKIIKEYVDGFELTNLNEDKLLKDSNANSSLKFVSNLFYGAETLAQNQDDLIFDISYLEQVPLAHQFNRLSLRLRPPQKINQGKNSRFGLTAKEVIALSRGQTLGKKVECLHFHLNFEQNTLDDIKLSIDYLMRIKSKYFPEVTTINIGGGLKPLKVDEIRQLLFHMSSLNVIFLVEAGRLFTDNVGYALAHVNSIRPRGRLHEIGTNISRDCHLKWSRPESFTHIPLGKSVDKVLIKGGIRICGPTSFEGDVIFEGEVEKMIPLKLGDYLLISNVSGYSVAWNHSFNGIPMAKIVFC